MGQFLCVIDENNREVPGSRRKVDFVADPAHFRQTYAALERSAGEGCWIYDSHADGRRPTLLSNLAPAFIVGTFWLAVAAITGNMLIG
ncbi:hypothetical protein [Alteraurantiacibacter buctensis]|uniref:Uncharacterized protein n=1 Tax=Alteraurantiacibacter buctensis TaxID=1503981 RepID=A0A844Z224_9SPHN|nr:hypothetical protein [Alteraurantiacibacter buctensis]MXO73572.1 hypothetical protein [Alteraurantiacibacter buctensis]